MVAIVRHGATDFNRGNGNHGLLQEAAEERYRGNLPIPLNAQGRREAMNAAANIGMPVKMVVADDHYPRDLETAQIIAQHTGAPLVIDERMQPINIGDVSGKSKKATYKLVDWFFQHPDAVFPGGEAVGSFYQRQKSAILEYLDKDGGDPSGAIVIVGQGSTIRTLPAMLHNDDWSLIESTMERVGTGEIHWIQ
jgi:broad specificity phosphatase PhoE